MYIPAVLEIAIKHHMNITLKLTQSTAHCKLSLRSFLDNLPNSLCTNGPKSTVVNEGRALETRKLVPTFLPRLQF